MQKRDLANYLYAWDVRYESRKRVQEKWTDIWFYDARNDALPFHAGMSVEISAFCGSCFSIKRCFQAVSKNLNKNFIVNYGIYI